MKKPKLEIRNPKETRSPKSDPAGTRAPTGGRLVAGFETLTSRQLNLAEVDAMDACLAGKHDLAVAPIPPVLQVTSVGSGSVTLEWASRAGRRYQLQSTTNLSATSWINEGPPFTGTGGGLATDQLTGSATEKFFRLQLTGN